MPPRFSVIVPAYNAAATVGMTIRSILAQTERDLELVVVDDGSTDETPDVAAQFGADPRMRLVRQANQGTAGARNAGVELTSAPYVSFLDNDDLWMPGYLEAMGAALDRAPRAGFAYCDAWNLDGVTLRIGRATELERRPAPPPGAGREQILEALIEVNFVMSSATVRREALTGVAGFDAAIRGTDDYDLWLRILVDGWTAVRAGEGPLLLQRGLPDSQSKDERMMDANLRPVLRRLAADERSPAAARGAAERVIAAVDRELNEDASPTLRRRAGELLGLAARARNRFRAAGLYYDEPPAEVAAAFPELRRTSS